MLKYVIAWIPMVFIAIVNGTLRQVGYGKFFTELQAHQLSTLIGAILFGIYIGWVIHRWCPASTKQAVGVGLMWLGMTVAFELLFGHFVAGHAWVHLWQDYNFAAGRVWSLLLIWVAVAPYIFYRLRQ